MSTKLCLIELYNVNPELIFVLMNVAMGTCPLDGCVALICGNPKFVKSKFVEWIKNDRRFSSMAIQEEGEAHIVFVPEETFLFDDGSDISLNDWCNYMFSVVHVCGYIDPIVFHPEKQ